MQPNDRQQYLNNSQSIPATTTGQLISQPSQNVPLLAHLGATTVDTETYFQQYRNLLAGFKGNIDCRLIPSRKGDTFILTKAGAEKICRFFGLNYSLIPLAQTKLDFEQNTFYYAYECQLSYVNVVVGNGFGNCNNRESKYVKAYSPDILNTIDKMAQKRALVSAVLFTTGGSRFFGQKVGDLNA